jgi:hypothetical protein
MHRYGSGGLPALVEFLTRAAGEIGEVPVFADVEGSWLPGRGDRRVRTALETAITETFLAKSTATVVVSCTDSSLPLERLVVDSASRLWSSVPKKSRGEEFVPTFERTCPLRRATRRFVGHAARLGIR